MDISTHDFKDNSSEKETAQLFQNLDLKCVALNWKLKSDLKFNQDEGEIDGIFLDEINQIYLIYDDSVQRDNRQDKISKFLNKWKDKDNQHLLREKLNLMDYPIYVLYIDKSNKNGAVDSINYTLDEFTKIIYSEDYEYFNRIFKIVGKWSKNDLFNFLEIKPRKVTKEKISATQIWIGNTPAYVFADRVENILKYCFISRRRNNSVGYQRLVEKSRVDKMAGLIKTDRINAFPNSILLNCIDNLDFQPKAKSECPCKVEINLPNNFSSCKVVDGQHRLLAFSKLDIRIQDSHSLPIVLFQNMPLEKEVQTFIEINDTQKGIDPNLIFSLKSDLSFQVGSKENKEKIAVKIAEKLNKDSGLFKSLIFFGNSGEEKKGKITLTTVVQSLINFKIVDSHKGFLQEEENDVENPYIKIKSFIKLLLEKDRSNIIFYKTNNGIQLILKYCVIIYRNIEKKFINIDIETAIDLFIESVSKNKSILVKRYGKAGFNQISNIIFNDIVEKEQMKLLKFEFKELK